MVTVLQKADENINYEKFAQQPVSVVSCLRKEGGGSFFGMHDTPTCNATCRE